MTIARARAEKLGDIVVQDRDDGVFA